MPTGSSHAPAHGLDFLRGQVDEMLEVLEDLVMAESPTNQPDATRSCAARVASAGERLLEAAPETLEVDGRPHLRWSFGKPKILLIGHLDTVWALGTTTRWPFSVHDGRATGPGIFDMKAGLVQMFFALRTLDDLDGVTIIINSDEEIGSPTSGDLIEDAARAVQTALVLEPSANGALKVARKGASSFELRVAGRAAHAGLEPEAGVNATIELAHQILRIAELADPERGTSVTPTLISGGMAFNTVPASASVYVDVRVETSEEQLRVEEALTRLEPVLPDATLEVIVGRSCPPLPESASAELFSQARAIGEQLGFGRLDGVLVGGASDGNRTAGVGTPTLDGLGAVGDRAHAEGEHVSVAAMPERAALVAELVRSLLGAS